MRVLSDQRMALGAHWPERPEPYNVTASRRAMVGQLVNSLDQTDPELAAAYKSAMDNPKHDARTRRGGAVYWSRTLPLFGGGTDHVPAASDCRASDGGWSGEMPKGRSTYWHEPSHRLERGQRRCKRFSQPSPGEAVGSNPVRRTVEKQVRPIPAGRFVVRSGKNVGCETWLDVCEIVLGCEGWVAVVEPRTLAVHVLKGGL